MHAQTRKGTFLKRELDRLLCFAWSFDQWMRQASTPWIVAAALVLSYVIVLPLALLFAIFDSNYDLSGPTFSSGTLGTLLVVCLLGPPLETLVFQWLPIRLMQRAKIFRFWQMIVVSAVFFGLNHGYSAGYMLDAALSGVVLAYIFIICDKTGKQSFWVVSLVHALRNLVGFLIAYLTIGLPLSH